MTTKKLILFATEQEAKDSLKFQHENDYVTISVSGVGKLNAAISFANFLGEVDSIILLGTCAAYSKKYAKVGDILTFKKFYEHDMDASGLGFDLGEVPFQKKKNVVSFGKGHAIMTGDKFISDRNKFGELVKHFKTGFIDMEAFAVAKLCERFDIDFKCIKYITDNGDVNAGDYWSDIVKDASKKLAKVVENEL